MPVYCFLRNLRGIVSVFITTGRLITCSVDCFLVATYDSIQDLRHWLLLSRLSQGLAVPLMKQLPGVLFLVSSFLSRKVGHHIIRGTYIALGFGYQRSVAWSTYLSPRHSYGLTTALAFGYRYRGWFITWVSLS